MAHTAPGGMKPPHQEPTAQEPRQLAGSDPVRCQIWPPPPPPAPHLAAFAAEPVAAHGVVGQRALLAAVSPALRALLPGQQPAWHVSHPAMPVAPGHGRGEQTLVPTHRQRAAVALLSCLHEAVAALRRVQELPGSRWGEARATGSVPKQGVATSPPPPKKGHRIPRGTAGYRHCLLFAIKREGPALFPAGDTGFGAGTVTLDVARAGGDRKSQGTLGAAPGASLPRGSEGQGGPVTFRGLLKRQLPPPSCRNWLYSSMLQRENFRGR